MKYICDTCHKEFNDKPSKKRKYCSVGCTCLGNTAGSPMCKQMNKSINDLLDRGKIRT